MPLNFPRKPEVRLQDPPLSEVVCQIRFPAILRILKEEPIDFQEQIRERFPELRVELGLALRLAGSGSQDKPDQESGARVFRFLTADELTTVSLAVDFFALSTRRYRHWAVFAGDLDLIHGAVQSVYRPAYATRIGLRYINRFTMENTGVDSLEELRDLFHPDLTSLLRSEAWIEPAEMLSQLVLTDGEAKLKIRTGFGRGEEEPFFVLDFDYFASGKLGLDGLVDRLDQYHQTIYDAFRWCVPEDGLSRFRPIHQEAA